MRLTILILLLCTRIHAQEQPQIFEPGLISNNGVFGFTLSPDGSEAFWVQSNGGRDSLIIMSSHKVHGEWQSLKPASFSGNYEWKDIDPVFSPDGNKVLFQSDRPVPGKPDRTGFDIWAVERTKNGWSEPMHLGNVLNSDASESFASITKNGNIYFMKQNPDGTGSSDVYVSRYIADKYHEPENLGHPINTSFRESNPFISADEDFIIYFSSDTSGFGGVDLFISYKEDDKWSTPKNLGPVINGPVGEFCPFYHQKQKTLYFSRTEQTEGGRRIENIYSIAFVPGKER